MSHSPTPEPRPALRKAADGSVHPASAVLSSLAVELPAAGGMSAPGSVSTSAPKPAKSGSAKGGPSSDGAGKKSKKGKAKKADAAEEVEVVALQVELAKPVRKALRKRAADYGWTAEEAAAHVLRVWADDRR